ncbi:DUF3024 domain-containing protein [Lysobacter capsici]|uniref:DUF3024 domain-containing protein n=1 Tax=Lysobacter capsici TaxID=435897 RepID=UPI00287B7855|nr:DUF3024 domain-containing protein [Lysobacter capsici]WND80447.1 DUF3024 domain-containing protein [Lysobacter capsici]WND85644.1 DUF3024 domain-containing protein [Lysobacter capsici]
MLNDLERKRAEKILAGLLAPRHSPHVKSGGVVRYRIVRQSIEVFSERPAYDNPAEMIEIPIAKLRYVRITGVWQLFWSRANGSWDRYSPKPDAGELSELVAEVWSDPYFCFWG